MEPTRSTTVIQFFRELGDRLTQPATLTVGGSIALILAGILSRRTDNIDIAEKVPDQLHWKHDLRLTHFQSHYIPTGWESRLTSQGIYGQLTVRCVHPTDIFLGKLFSNREKDLDDLRALAPHFDKTDLFRRLLQTTASLRSEPSLRAHAAKNWYILHGERPPELS